MRRPGTGVAAGFAAYALWGVFPLYWPLLEPATPPEILAGRIVFSLVFIAALLALTGGFGWIRALSRRQLGLLAVASVLISVNWGTFIHGVTSEQVVETSLGYFITPLVSVALGVVVLGERLRRAQWAAVGIGVVAVGVLTAELGHPPVIALTLACSFGVYGLVKKRAGVDGLPSLAVETALLVPLALAYLLWLEERGEGTLTTEGAGHVALLVGGGVLTAVPLILFGIAALRVPLTTIGLLQYLAPTLQLLIGVLVYGEPLGGARLAGFALVWLALAVASADALRAARAAPPPGTAPREPVVAARRAA